MRAIFCKRMIDCQEKNGYNIHKSQTYVFPQRKCFSSGRVFNPLIAGAIRQTANEMGSFMLAPDNKKIMDPLRLTAIAVLMCLMLSGCRFAGLHSPLLEDAGWEPTVTAVDGAEYEEPLPDGVASTQTVPPEETAVPTVVTEPTTSETTTSETTTSETTAETMIPEITTAETTTEEPTTAEPEQLKMIDIYDLFQMGKGLEQTAPLRKAVTRNMTFRSGGVTYEYGACTDYIAKEDLEEFFYSGKTVCGDNICVAFVYEFPEMGSENLLRRKPLLLQGDRYVYRYSFDCRAIRITFSFEKSSAKKTKQELTEDVLRDCFAISPANQETLYFMQHADDPEALQFGFSDAENNQNPGIDNLLALARQEATIQYELRGDLPAQTAEGYIPAKDENGNPTKLIGLPYSSVRSIDKMINLNVSTYTFLTALYNPGSVLYTRYIASGNAKTFYGTVCSVFTDYSQNIPWNLPTKFLRSEHFSQAYYKKSIEEMTVGDMFIDASHVIMITDLYRDMEGTIKAVEYSEAKRPVVRTTTLTYENFKVKIESTSYQCFGYKGISQVKYSPLPYVAAKEGETVEEINYPDIMCEFGDKAVLMGGSGSAATFEREVTINVLDREGYYAIQVYRDSVHPIDYERNDRDYELLETRSTVKDFVMGDPENGLVPGAYKIVMRGVDKTSTTEFFVVDAVCHYENNRVYWRCTNASADIVFLYTKRANNDPILLSGANMIRSNILGYQYYLDLAPRMAEHEAQGEDGYDNVKITFRTKYGTATWYSYFNKNWVKLVDG